MLKLFLTFSLLISNIIASDIKNQELSKDQMKAQNKRIVKLASQEMSKSLPQTIDKVTTLTKILANETTLEFIHEIDISPKTDKMVMQEDHSRMSKAITKGTCKSSTKFLEADISLSYIYLSKKTKAELFRFKVTQQSCFNF